MIGLYFSVRVGFSASEFYAYEGSSVASIPLIVTGEIQSRDFPFTGGE